ncbi:MAG TPA: hypothetical protein VHC70_09580, partial [Phycisphaerales bacterium]|nr:hypothetical protein [Phycisphaerales bacterium]
MANPADVTYTYNYVKGDSGYGRSDTGGTVETITATFNPGTKRLTFDAYFSGATSGGSLITSGFWLVLNNGPNPKTHPGELAIFYFDATTLSSPKLTVYGYNGQNANTSWQDGNPDVSGNQTGDLIKGVYETSYINAILAENTTVNGASRRHFRFDIDASDIVSHVPLYPAASPWYGTGFDSSLGIWFHSVDVFTASYESNSGGNRGRLTALSVTSEGWLDGSDRTTTSNDPCPPGSHATPTVSTCSPNPCPQPRACCDTTSGACTIVPPAADCPTGSTFASPGASTCSPNPCPQPMACCNPVTGACSVVPPASVLYTYNYVKGDSGYGRSDVGGTVETITATFNPATKRLTFDAYFSGATSGGSLITSGFWLVLNNGPNPKTHPGELAIFYFDASTLSSPKLTVYGYNGQNANTSWQDGNPDVSGNQAGDLIKGVYETSFINAILAENTTVNGASRRHLKFDIDATDIINHVPLYPAASPWFGTGFDSSLGLWFHSVDVFTATYESSGSGVRGGITSLSTQTEGWLDASDRTTTSNDPCPSGSHVYPGASSCTPNPCPQPRACCDPATGVCTVVPPASDCPTGSTFYTPGTSSCSPNPCPQPGRCCTSAAVCTVTMQSACVAPNTWTQGLTCTTVCPGVCCSTTSCACTTPSASGCASGSTYQGSSSTCNPVPCVGKCCNVGTGACAVLAPSACAAPNVFTCGGTCGTVCPGVCCSVSTCACTTVLATGCPSGSNYMGPSSVCSPNPCPGVCCNASTCACSSSTAAACTSPNTFYCSGSCTPTPCMGKCCSTTTGACTITASTACASPSVFTCAATCGTVCPGVCCNASCACTAVTASGCAAGSTYMGPSSTCSPNPCPGVCCNLSTCACTTGATSATCTGTGFTFYCNGTCTPSPCTGVCCDNTTCACTTGATLATCTGSGKTFYCNGACSPSPCLGVCCNTSSCACTTGATSATCASPNTFYCGGSCTPNPCLGKCCDVLTGLCSTTALADCSGTTKSWSCSACCPVIIACCNVTTGACTEVAPPCPGGTIFDAGSCPRGIATDGVSDAFTARGAAR